MGTARLELAAAQALYAARALERALHEETGWEIRWGDVRVPATRTVTDTAISFEATFPDLCYLERPGSHVDLLHDGEVVGIRPAEHPGDTMFVVNWTIVAKHAPEPVAQKQ